MSAIEQPGPPAFRLTASKGDGIHELQVEGELDLAVAGRLQDAISRTDGSPVLVDLSRCHFLDSTGIAVVLLAQRNGARIALHSPSDQVQRILSTLGLTDDGFVFATREQAVSALTSPRQG